MIPILKKALLENSSLLKTINKPDKSLQIGQQLLSADSQV
jgi:hypothetical protein